MMRSMYIGDSGLTSMQTALDTISNNIANDQTDGFKSQQANFQELFYQQYQAPSAPNGNYGGTNPIDVGNGTEVGSISTNFTQGNIDQTGNPTDMAIQGDGFFVLGDGNGQNPVYTRNGAFQMSKTNQLMNAQGEYVLGWNMNPATGAIDTTSNLSPISLPIGQVSTPHVSTQMQLTGNLNAQDPVGNVYGIQTQTWDQEGAEHDVGIDFINNGSGNFNYVAIPTNGFQPSKSISSATMDVSAAIESEIQKGNYTISTAAGTTAGTVNITVKNPAGTTISTQTVPDSNQTVTLTDSAGNDLFNVNYVAGGAPSTATFTVGEAGTLTFNGSGQLTSATGSGPSGGPEITYTSSSTGQPVNINVSMNGLTQLAAGDNVQMSETDGSGTATLQSFNVTNGGVIEGIYSDGTQKAIAQVALASFANDAGLTRVGNGNFTSTPNSGAPNVGLPNTGNRGQIQSQALETSNVDLGTEFVNLMTIQSAYTADTKIISTTNNVLDQVINLIQG